MPLSKFEPRTQRSGIGGRSYRLFRCAACAAWINDLPLSLMGQVLSQSKPTMRPKNVARLVGATDLPNNHEGSSLIDGIRVMRGVLFRNLHRHEGTEKRTAGRAEGRAANAADNRAHAWNQRASDGSSHGAGGGSGHGAGRGTFRRILLELHTRRARNDPHAAIGHVDTIRGEAGSPQSRYSLFRLRLLFKYTDHQVFSCFVHKAISWVEVPDVTAPVAEKPATSQEDKSAKRMPVDAALGLRYHARIIQRRDAPGFLNAESRRTIK